MKKLLPTLLTAFTLSSTAALADGDNGLYLGLGYASTNIDVTADFLNDDHQKILDTTMDSVMFQVGYDFNTFFGIEGRYYVNNSRLTFDYYFDGTPLEGTYKADTFALYAKPQYNFGLITLYGLLGMASNDYTVTNFINPDDDTVFSWGGGAKLNITQSFGVFIDYTDLGDTEMLFTDTGLHSWNVGISYKF
jgi:hypothetical protein